MLAGVQRRGDANAGGQIPRPHAAADDHIVGVNRAVVRIYARDAFTIVADFCDFGVFKYRRAAGSRTLGKRLRNIHRIGITVARYMDAADDIIDIDDFGQILNFLRGYDVHRQVKHLGHGSTTLQLLKPLLIGRHRDRSALAITGSLPGFCFQPAIQFAGIFGELGHVD